MKEENKYLPITFQNNPWMNNENSIWIGSTVALSRNIEKFNFPNKLSTDKR